MELIKIPRRITEEFILTHPQYHFLYSSSYQAAAHYGQSKEAHDCPNTSPVPVRYSLCQSSGFFSDNIISLREFIVMPAILKALQDAAGKPIIPFPRIGEGRSRMKEFAYGHWLWMNREIEKIKWGNIEYV